MATSTRKNVLITGAGRGIGYGLALSLAEHGYNIGVHYNSSEEGAMKVCEEIRAFGVKALPIKADLSDVSQIRKMFKEFFDEFGTIDVLINNSGITKFMSIFDATEEHFNLLTSVDWRASFFATQQAAINMRENNTEGVIINISSVHKEAPMGNDSVYACAKAAILRFTKHAALEFAPYGIRVNCISPGWIKTGNFDSLTDREAEVCTRLPLHRVGRPEEIANAVLFLIDEKSSYITGVDIPVDGGLPIPAMLDNTRFPLPKPNAANLG